MQVFIYDRSIYFSGSFISFLQEVIADIEVSYFPNEEELLKMTESVKPKLIIIDIKHPGIKSFELIQTLKKVHKSTVIVCMYILVDEFLKKQCLENGADYVLDKYLEYEQIIGIVNLIRTTDTT